MPDFSFSLRGLLDQSHWIYFENTVTTRRMRDERNKQRSECVFEVM